ncbi:MAG: hypothetical protein QG671_859 [Actinomycetota bacterium]|nr:hypothetical protein [Actinomycetota bacterium]
MVRAGGGLVAASASGPGQGEGFGGGGQQSGGLGQGQGVQAVVLGDGEPEVAQVGWTGLVGVGGAAMRPGPPDTFASGKRGIAGSRWKRPSKISV